MEESFQKPIKILKRISLRDVPWGVLADRVSVATKVDRSSIIRELELWQRSFSRPFLLARYLKRSLTKSENLIFSHLSQTLGADSVVICNESLVVGGVLGVSQSEEVLITPQFSHEGRGDYRATGTLSWRGQVVSIDRIPRLLLLHLVAFILGIGLTTIALGLVIYGVSVLYLSLFHIDQIIYSPAMEVRLALALGAVTLGGYTLFGRNLLLSLGKRIFRMFLQVKG